MQKYTAEYWAVWRTFYQKGYDHGYRQMVLDPPKRWSMFYEAYMGGYQTGAADYQEQH